jgi:hypothetical protein
MSVLTVFAESERWFTAAQTQLLDGLLGDDATSEQALRAWAAAVDLDAIDNASYRLIPALYARAGMSPSLQPLQGRMKGIYRYYFYRNNRFLAHMERVLAALTQAGVDFILFKGASVVIQYHGSAALRSSSDCDILVRPGDKASAEAVLAHHGFAYRYDAERKRQDRHSHDFVDRAEHGLDLHWYALFESCEEGADDGFWARSRHIEWKGQRLRVLAPEDEALVAGVNGIREIDEVRADWLYDVWTILRAAPRFDWRRLHQELVRRKLQERFLTAMGQFHRFIPSLPTAFLEREFASEIKNAARRLTAENRTFALEEHADRALSAWLAPAELRRRLVGYLHGTDWRGDIARSHDVVRHMRYDTHDDGSISDLHLHRDAEPFLGDVFDIADPTALETAGDVALRRDEAVLILPPGVLRIPQQPRPRRYAFPTSKPPA